MSRLILISLTILATVAVAGEKQRPPTPVAETFQEVMRLRMSLDEFYAAPNTDAARQLHSRWQDIPADVRRRIESRHPGTELRLRNLESEVPEVVPAPKPETNTVTEPVAPATPDIWAKSGAVPPAADPWPTPRDPAPAANPRRFAAPVQFSDDLDIFGNRPRAHAPNR